MSSAKRVKRGDPKGKSMEANLRQTTRSRIKRQHERAAYDRESVNAILDATGLCHVAYALDGEAFITPTFHWREGDHVYWHGSAASRFLRRATDARVSLCVSILDGLVLARSAFHHSANYRSVVLYGTAHAVADADKEARLHAFTESLYPGRWEMLRPITAQEIKATTVLGMPIEEGSAKVRTGMPVDDEEDYALPIWAGVLPVQRAPSPPLADPRNLPGVETPRHVRFPWKD